MLLSPIYATGFAKRGLPHTSDFINLEDHNFDVKRHMKLKLSPSIKHCRCILLTKSQVNRSYQSEVMNCQWIFQDTQRETKIRGLKEHKVQPISKQNGFFPAITCNLCSGISTKVSVIIDQNTIKLSNWYKHVKSCIMKSNDKGGNGKFQIVL